MAMRPRPKPTAPCRRAETAMTAVTTPMATQLTALPDDAHGILRDLRVRRHDGQAERNRLGDQQAIERVAVELRQSQALKGGVLVERKRGDAAQPAFGGYQPVGRFRKREPPHSVLDDNLPARHWA